MFFHTQAMLCSVVAAPGAVGGFRAVVTDAKDHVPQTPALGRVVCLPRLNEMCARDAREVLALGRSLPWRGSCCEVVARGPARALPDVLSRVGDVVVGRGVDDERGGGVMLLDCAGNRAAAKAEQEREGSESSWATAREVEAEG